MDLLEFLLLISPIKQEHGILIQKKNYLLVKLMQKHIIHFSERKYTYIPDQVMAQWVFILTTNWWKAVHLSSETGDFISFTSEDLPFGQHTIKVEHKGETGTTISFKAICYRPHLLYSGTVISPADLPNLPEKWKKFESTDSSPSYIETGQLSTAGDSFNCVFNFSGTRFWLTGLKSKDHKGKVEMTIDDNVTETINAAGSYNKVHYSYLLYSSNILNMGEHKVEITVRLSSGGTSANAKFAICDFIYSQQPKDSTIIYHEDLQGFEFDMFDEKVNYEEDQNDVAI